MSKIRVLINGRIVKTLKAGITLDNMRAKYPQHAFEKCNRPPAIKTLENWVCNGVAEAVDGCRVEPDGSCEHGYKSWLLVLGYI